MNANDEIQADIEIEHTREAGTLAYGTSKGDAGDVILRQHGFRWFGSRRALGIQHSRDRRADRFRIEQARTALEAAGLVVKVTIDDAPRATADVEADRASRGAERAERFEGYAHNAAGRAVARQAAADRVFENRPPGQPLLVDHYSYIRESNRLDRAHRNEERAREERGKARHWQSRAEASENEMRHREDIPTTLRRIETLEAERRKYQRALDGAESGWNAGPDGDPEARAELTSRVAELDEKIGYWREHVATAEAAGVKVWRREDFKKGDYAKVFGRWWCEVLRVNAKSVSIPHPLHPWNTTAPYDKISGRMTAEEMAEHNKAAAARRAAKQAEAAGAQAS